MNRYLLDTNCLLSFVTDRNESQRERVLHRFHEAAQMQAEVHIIPNVIDEFVYVLLSVYESPEAKVAEMIRTLYAEPGVVFHDTQSIPDILALWPALIKEYGDAVIASSAKRLNLPVMTLDVDLARALKKMGLAVLVP